jgi:hypothetical protein
LLKNIEEIFEEEKINRGRIDGEEKNTYGVLYV